MKIISRLGLLFWFSCQADQLLAADKVLSIPDTKGKLPVIIPIIDILTTMYSSKGMYSFQTQIALETIHRNGILSDYDISFEVFDTACSNALGTNIFIRNISDPDLASNNQTLPLLLGPLCEDRKNIGKIAYYVNFISLIGFNQNSQFYDRPEMYKNLLILPPSTESFVWALPVFLAANKWEHIFFFGEQRSPQYTDIFLEQCKVRNITVNVIGTRYDDRESQEPIDALENVVVRLKAQSARIIIFDTTHIVQLSCFLYKHGMYGPHYVFLQFNPFSFGENTPFRYAVPGCTVNGLHEVLKSIIFYGYAVNSNVDSARRDIFGMNTLDVEKRLLELLPEARQTFFWGMYRTQYYDFAIFSALALNRTAEVLSKQGSKLSDWTLGSENFHKNPKYITNLLMESFKSIKHEGLWATINKESDWNARRGKTVFYQVQEISQGVFKPVAVASHENAQLLDGPGELVWKTRDGHPPKGIMQITEVEKAMINLTASIVLLSFGVLMFIVNSAVLVANIHRRTAMGNYIWLLNCVMLFGNYSLILVSVSISVVTPVNVTCPISFFLATFGIVVVYSAIGLRLRIAYHHQSILLKQQDQMKRLKSARSFKRSGLGFGSLKDTTSITSQGTTGRTAMKSIRPTENMKVCRLIVVVTFYSILFVAPLIVIFCTETWRTEKIYGELDIESVDLAYQPFQFVCASTPIGNYSPLALAFFIIGVVMAAIPIVSSSFLAVVVRNFVEGRRVTDVGHFRSIQMITAPFLLATVIAVFAVSTQGIGVILILIAAASLVLSMIFLAGVLAEL